MMPETFCDSTTSYLPEALLLQGRYKEAAELFKATTGYYYSQLNGRNRNLLQSMASKLGDEDHQMQIMQEQLKNQQTRILYNTILIFIFLISQKIFCCTFVTVSLERKDFFGHLVFPIEP